MTARILGECYGKSSEPRLSPSLETDLCYTDPMSILDLEPKMIVGSNGEELVVLTLTKAEWRVLEAKLSEDETMPVFASIGAGESDLNGADSETWLRENWK